MSENIFDDLQDGAFDVVTNTMGYDATWEPSEGGATRTVRVLFNNPTETRKLSGVEYDPYRWEMEYKEGDFDGLKASVDANNVEVVTVKGHECYVRRIVAKLDGRTFIAEMEPKTIE